jgi:hypothetical protein
LGLVTSPTAGITQHVQCLSMAASDSWPVKAPENSDGGAVLVWLGLQGPHGSYVLWAPLCLHCSSCRPGAAHLNMLKKLCVPIQLAVRHLYIMACAGFLQA